MSLISPVWTQDQLSRKARAAASECVVANMHPIRAHPDGYRVDEALLLWAEQTNRLVAVDRRSRFGNPFKIPKDGTREIVIDKFKQYFALKPSLQEAIRTYHGQGKVFVCFCHPLSCHGHYLADWANAP